MKQGDKFQTPKATTPPISVRLALTGCLTDRPVRFADEDKLFLVFPQWFSPIAR